MVLSHCVQSGWGKAWEKQGTVLRADEGRAFG